MSKIQSVIKYTGSIQALKGEPYAGSDFSFGNVMQMKTKGVSVILNSNGLGFRVLFDDIGYVDATATYTFDRDCIIAFGEMIEVIG